MADVFLDELAPIVTTNTSKDSHCYGMVTALNSDGSVQVKLGASSTTTRCALGCSAAVDDVVLVLIKSDGKCVVIANLTNPTTTNSITLNGTLTPNPSFYAPLGAGTDGQVLRSTGGVPAWSDQWELLWTNGSPTSSFAAQDVTTTKPCSDYDFLAIEIMALSTSSSGSGVALTIAPYVEGNSVTATAWRCDTGWEGARDVIFHSSYVHFNVGRFYYHSEISASVGNQYAVPYHIYGIKGVG